MHTIHIELTLTMQSKFHVGSGEGSLIVDRLIRRDACNRPYLPATTLKGIIRENCEKLSRSFQLGDSPDPHDRNIRKSENFTALETVSSLVVELFGNKYEEGGLFFRNAYLGKSPEYKYDHFAQSRICKYRKLGTAKDQHLFSSEYALPGTFSTTIDGYHRSLQVMEDDAIPYAYCLLLAGILYLERVGGDKSTGCGEIKAILKNAKYNNKNFALEKIFDYLDRDFYEVFHEKG